MQKPFFKFTEAVNDNGTVWYTVQVTAKGQDPEPIIFKQRYSQLRQIHQKCMETQFRNDLPDFPEKKLFGATKQDFIQKRKKALQNYYNTLVKIVNIQKLPQLNNYIQSHRKKKTEKKPNQQKQVTQSVKLEATQKKYTQLKATFQGIYKDVLGQIIDLKSDFYPMAEMAHDDNSKKYSSQIQQIKPQQSHILSIDKIEGLEENQTDFWSMFLKDEHEQFINRSLLMLNQTNAIEKNLRSLQKQSIVVIK